MPTKGPAQFSVDQQLVFYGSYHSHPINVAIHMVFVPVILWTMQVFLAMIPVPDFAQDVQVTVAQTFVFVLNWSAFQTAFLFVYYFLLDPIATMLYLPVMLFILSTATDFANRTNALLVTVPVHIVSWIAQFLGHGLAEKRAPALMDNLAAAFILAPFFVHLEVLFALGYRPALHSAVKEGTTKEIRKFNAEKTTKVN